MAFLLAVCSIRYLSHTFISATELEVVTCVLQMLNHYSSVRVIGFVLPFGFDIHCGLATNLLYILDLYASINTLIRLISLSLSH